VQRWTLLITEDGKILPLQREKEGNAAFPSQFDIEESKSASPCLEEGCHSGLHKILIVDLGSGCWEEEELGNSLGCLM